VCDPRRKKNIKGRDKEEAEKERKKVEERIRI
jgi:hypothetical protein